MTRRKIRQTARSIPAFALAALLIPLMVVADQRTVAATGAIVLPGGDEVTLRLDD